MSETTAAQTEKPARIVTKVKMSDGREVEFVGKRKLNKTTILDETKIVLDGTSLLVNEGAIAIRMDFLNGETRTFPLKLSLIPRFAGHGGEQKYGDELASPADKPLSPEDMVIAVDELHSKLESGEWRAKSDGDSFAGAALVIQAIVIANKEKFGKDISVEAVKAFLQKKLDDDKAAGGKMTRKALYDSYKVEGTKTGEVFDRLQKAALSKTSVTNADADLAEMTA